MANNIDLITTDQYFSYEEREHLTSSPEPFKKSSIEQFITQASSYAERFCHRPLVIQSDIDVPTDMNGDAITIYNPYDSEITGVLSPSNPMPFEIQLACSHLVRWFRFQAEHTGMTGQSDQDKTKNYSERYHQQADQILLRYKYWEPLDRTAQRFGDDYNLTGGVDA